MRNFAGMFFALLAGAAAAQVAVQEYPLPPRVGAHDVWADPAPDGPVWFSAQRSGQLGRLDPKTGKVEMIPLTPKSSPHGVITGADGAPWLTDGGQNAIVRVDPKTHQLKSWPLPEGTGYANLNTAIFDKAGIHWFTGQSGYYGRLDPKTGEMKVFEAPKGRGPYGIHATPDGTVYYASLAGSYIARLDGASGKATVIEPPTRDQGADEARALGVKALSVVADVARRDQVERMVARALSELGRVDILINNAAIRPHKPFVELTVEDWEEVRGVVLDGAFYCTRAVVESMIRHRYGRFLFFTGMGAFVGGAKRAHVSAAKMGLVGMARSLAVELAPHNIRVNVVSPGSIDTSRENPQWYGGRTPDASGIPLGRQGTVDEIAGTCLFLVSDDGGFITGQTIHANGGVAFF